MDNDIFSVTWIVGLCYIYGNILHGNAAQMNDAIRLIKDIEERKCKNECKES